MEAGSGEGLKLRQNVAIFSWVLGQYGPCFCGRFRVKRGLVGQEKPLRNTDGGDVGQAALCPTCLHAGAAKGVEPAPLADKSAPAKGGVKRGWERLRPRNIEWVLNAFYFRLQNNGVGLINPFYLLGWRLNLYVC